MHLEQITSPLVDIYFPSQYHDMNRYVDEDWIASGEVSRVLLLATR